jgi:DNA-binding winged helix-turn-helix (wHTH) protein/tetratricopeptide (TPR) repeat protein
MSASIYRFAGVELDSSSRSLRADDHRVDITPLVFDTLAFLAQRSERVVSKDELAAALWEGKVVSDAAITQAIRKARAALEECGADPSIITTRHGHGYQLDTPVEVRGRKHAAATTGDGPHGHLTRLRERRPMLALAIAIAGGGLIALANLSDIADFVFPDRSLEAIEDTRSTLMTTDAKVDEIVKMLRNQAASSGNQLDPDAESTIRDAVQRIIESGDARKQTAVDQLLEGDPDAAAVRIERVAMDLGRASEESRAAAAESWSEAGAIYYTTDVAEAVRCYEEALALQPDNAEYAAQLGFAYVRAGRLDDAVDVFGRGLNARPDDPVLIDTLRGLGTAARLKAEFGVAREHFDRAIGIARDTGDLRREGLLLLQLGSIASSQGNLELARSDYETVIERAEEIGDEHMLSRALNNFGIVLARTEDYAGANSAFTRAYEIDLARNDLAGQSQSIGNLGASALRSGNLDEATEHLSRSIEIGRELGDQRSIALDLTNLGSIAASRGDFPQAEARLEEALQIATAHGFEELRLIITVNLGEVARDSGDIASACRLWLEALPALVKLEHGAALTVQEYVDGNGCDVSSGAS